MSSLLKILAASTPARTLLSPAATVEIAFNAGYSTPAADRVWTDVTQYVRIVDGIDITHGRGDERGQADPNSLRLTLKNSDGRFTPGLSTSPYYPNVKIGRPVRVSVMTAAGHTSVRFDGNIDEWPLEWPAVVDTFATSTITATSRMARLGASSPLLNHIYEEYKRDSPVAHYMLDNLADSVGGAPLVQAGTGTTVTFEGTGPTDGIQAAQFTSGGRWLEVLYGSAIVSGGVTLEVTFLASAAPASSAGLAKLTAFDKSGGLYIEMGADGRITAGYGSNSVTNSVSLADGAIHHAALVTDGQFDGGTVSLYVDGTLAGSFTDTPGVPVSSYDASQLLLQGPTTVFAATFAHVGIYDSELSSTRVVDHATANLTGFAGETAEARLQRYAAFAGIPTAEQSFSTAADTPMAYIDTTGQTPLSLLQKVAETDGGVLYDSRDGLLTYTARSARYNAATVVTLDASAGQVEASYAPKLDRSSIINEVVATVADGSDPQETVRAVDQDSYDDYGPHRDDIELATTDADEVHAAAWWRVNTFGEPQARAPQLGVEIAHLSVALQASILGLNVGSKIAVSNLPSQSDAASKSFFVEGYTERIGPETHHFDLNISPTTGFDVWLLDDATYSVLGTSTTLAY